MIGLRSRFIQYFLFVKSHVRRELCDVRSITINNKNKKSFKVSEEKTK